MNPTALEEELSRMQKELRHGGAETEQRLLDVRVEMDRLRREVEAIKSYLSVASPAFLEQFPQILARTLEEVNPEFD